MSHTRRIARELASLRKDPPEGVLVKEGDALTTLYFYIVGPRSTSFDGRAFAVSLHFASDYPATPPKAFFETKIFHPNVGGNGEVCVSTLKRDWTRDLSLAHVLTTIRCLLIEPNPESALNEEAEKLLLEDYDTYSRRARLMTDVHAVRLDTAYRECNLALPDPHVLQDAAVNSMPSQSDPSSSKATGPCPSKAKPMDRKKSGLRRL